MENIHGEASGMPRPARYGIFITISITVLLCASNESQALRVYQAQPHFGEFFQLLSLDLGPQGMQ